MRTQQPAGHDKKPQTAITTQSEMSDGILVCQILAGDQRVFEVLVHRYHVPLFSFICHYLNDYDQASDIAQQTFLQLYISLPSLRTNEPLRAWLFQVARNRCLDELRRKRAIHFSELETSNDDDDELSPLAIMPDLQPLPDEIAEQRDLQKVLHEAIDALPTRFRAVVWLRYTAQLSFSEIGKTLNMPEATAKTYFQRSRPLLRATLGSRWLSQKVSLS